MGEGRQGRAGQGRDRDRGRGRRGKEIERERGQEQEQQRKRSSHSACRPTVYSRVLYSIDGEVLYVDYRALLWVV